MNPIRITHDIYNNIPVGTVLYKNHYQNSDLVNFISVDNNYNVDIDPTVVDKGVYSGIKFLSDNEVNFLREYSVLEVVSNNYRIPKGTILLPMKWEDAKITYKSSDDSYSVSMYTGAIDISLYGVISIDNVNKIFGVPVKNDSKVTKSYHERIIELEKQVAELQSSKSKAHTTTTLGEIRSTVWKLDWSRTVKDYSRDMVDIEKTILIFPECPTSKVLKKILSSRYPIDGKYKNMILGKHVPLKNGDGYLLLYKYDLQTYTTW